MAMKVLTVRWVAGSAAVGSAALGAGALALAYVDRAAAVEFPEREGEDQHVGEPHLSGGPEQLPADRRLADDQRADQQYERGEIRYRDQQHQRNRQPTQEPVLLTDPPRVRQHQWYEQDQLPRRLPAR
jgi:hypothetical protein